MRRLLKMVPIIFVVLLVLSCNPTVYESFGDLEGTVLDEETNKPIKYVYVMLSPGGKNMTTGADGKFSFVDLDPQQYTVTVQKNGYSTNRKSVNVIVAVTTRISISMKKND